MPKVYCFHNSKMSLRQALQINEDALLQVSVGDIYPVGCDSLIME